MKLFNKKNNKGAILPVTITCMVILLVIGLACLQMFYTQNILSVYDYTKLRTMYAAEGAVERLRAAMDNSYSVSSVGDFTYTSNGIIVTYGATRTSITKATLESETGVTLSTTYSGYFRIKGYASATVSSNFAQKTINSYVYYYYVCTAANNNGTRFFVAWTRSAANR